MAKIEFDKKYKNISIRLSDETREWLNLKWKNSGLSWNLFLIKLLKSYEYESLRKVPRKQLDNNSTSRSI
jgi:predicted DNA binding CopG/RHH family protein